MKNIHLNKLITTAAYLYLVLPVIIFFAGWLRWYYSFPAIAILIYASFLCIKQNTLYVTIDWRKYRSALIFAIVIIIGWVISSGIGGFTYQTPDHYFRNAVLKDLVEMDWPVVYDFSKQSLHQQLAPGKYMLVYYVGHWMPAALVGKMLGLQAAHIFLFLWSLAGIMLTFYFICTYLKRFSIWILFCFIFFSGMDGVGTMLFGIYQLFAHLEWWMGLQYSSNTTLLYWVFNQTIVPWLAVAMLMNNLPKKNVLFITALTFVYAPFPFIGLCPLLVYFIFIKKKESLLYSVINTISIQNIIGSLLILLVMFGFYTSNYADQDFSLADVELKQYLFFVLFEFLLLAAMLLYGDRRNVLLWLVVISLLIFPLLQFRKTPDFTMRASIPALFVLMMLTINYLYNNKLNRVAKSAIIVLLVFGAITPFNEITNCLQYTGKYWYYSAVDTSKIDFEMKPGGTIFKDNNPVVKSFVGDVERSFFYQHFCKKR